MSLVSSVPDASSFSHVSVIPQPSKIVPQSGFFRLTSQTSIVADQGAYAEASLLADWLSQSAGFPCPVMDDLETTGLRIVLTLDASLPSLGSEGYCLRVTSEFVEITAFHSLGLFYGVQTLLQLLPAAIFSDMLVEGQDWIIPCVDIEDAPRFAWRGAMLDVSRHFLPPAFLRKFIDLLALHKMNVLQLHLTDDQGWRIEIKKYPKLTEIGAHRNRTLVGYAEYSPTHEKFDPFQEQFDGTPYQGYYTQSEMRDLVEYARLRHVTIVPEIEMPGHAQAAIAAYPELGCTGEQIEVSPRWGIHDVLYKPSERTFEFLTEVLAEIIDIFPSPYIHIGGDEAVKTQWRSSSECQQFMREKGLPDEEAMQSYFIGRIDNFLMQRGRVLVGWDEILEGGLSPGAVVMSWRGEQGGVAAARQGHDVIMAPYQYTYFDYYQSEDFASEPLAFPELLTLSAVYGYEPIPADMPLEHQRHVLGAQCQLWTEYMPHTKQVEYMAFPRLSALSEVTWASRANKDYAGFLDRLPRHLVRLDALRVRYRPMVCLASPPIPLEQILEPQLG